MHLRTIHVVLFILIIATLGCGHVDLDDMSHECAVEGLKDIKAPQKTISCANFSINIAIARQMIIDRGWIVNETEFDSEYSSVNVIMHNEGCILNSTIGSCIVGNYLPADNFTSPLIDLNWDGKILGHELMHHYDWMHGRGDTSYLHKDWDALGYFKFADEYENAALPLN